MEQKLYTLPDGWEWVSLTDITVKTSNFSPAKSPKQKYTYIDISSIDRDTNIIVSPKNIFGADAPSRAKKEIQSKDILFATTRPNLKNIAIYLGEFEFPVASTGFCILRSSNKINEEFLFYFLISDFLQKQIAPFISGAQYPAITDKKLKSSQIPLPPLDEQKRIVTKLNGLFTRIDTAINHLQDNLQLAKDLFASVLDETFSSNLSKWKLMPLNKIATVARGKSKHRPRNDKSLFNGDYPFIQTGEVRSATKYISSYTATYNAKGLSQSKLWPKGTICLTIAANIGDVAILGIDACFPDSVVGITSNYESNEYIYYFLTTLKYHLDRKANAVAQKNINLRILSGIEIPIPPRAEQDRIVAFLNKLAKRTHAIEAATQEKLHHLKALKASLLDNAFRGQL